MEKRYLIKVVSYSERGAWYKDKIGESFFLRDYAYAPDEYFVLLHSSHGFHKKDVEIILESTVDDKLFEV
jgi:hypothetical protein